MVKVRLFLNILRDLEPLAVPFLTSSIEHDTVESLLSLFHIL